MGSGDTAEEVLPPVTPMRTTLARHIISSDLDSPAAPTTTSAAGSKEDKVDKSCVTPTSERFLLKPATTCPPAPRKPHPLKRKLDLPSRSFYVVSRDLTSVFVSISDPVNKKLRVGGSG